jgi:hypothetical protein
VVIVIICVATLNIDGLIRYMLHNENVYKDPLTFNPERFLGTSPEQDPSDIAFGFGRRWVYFMLKAFPFSELYL